MGLSTHKKGHAITKIASGKWSDFVKIFYLQSTHELVIH